MSNTADFGKLERLAAAGDPQAQFDLGLEYYSRYVDVSAVHLFQQAAVQGHAEAQLCLAEMYRAGHGVPVDEDQSLVWYRRASEGGFAPAQLRFGQYLESRGEYEESARLYRLAAEQGDPDALMSLGNALATGRGVETNKGAAFECCLRAAQQGHSDAQLKVAGFYLEGSVVEKDESAALSWLQQSADQGFAPAQVELGYLHLHGRMVAQNDTAAMDWFSKAAAQNNTDAQFALGLHHAYGRGVPIGSLKAYLWFSLAALHGMEEAAELRTRLGEPPDTEIAILAVNAANGDAESQRDLAIRFLNGQGIEEDREQASLWFRVAAEGGDAWAQTSLGIALKATQDPEKEREAVEWLRRAADQQDPRGWFNLGLSQWNGRGTAPDPVAGAASIMTASLLGLPEAKSAVEEIVKPEVPPSRWDDVFRLVQWPQFILILGPHIEGDLGEVQLSLERDGSGNAVWREATRMEAEIYFPENGETSPILSILFGLPVRSRNVAIERAFVREQHVVSITIDTRHILSEDGFPVYWKPAKTDFRNILAHLRMLSARSWVETLWG